MVGSAMLPKILVNTPGSIKFWRSFYTHTLLRHALQYSRTVTVCTACSVLHAFLALHKPRKIFSYS